VACQRCNFCCCCCWISGTINCSTRYDDISTCVLDLLHCSRLNPTSHRDLQACVQASNQRQVAEWCLPCSLLVKTSMHANNMSTQFSCFLGASRLIFYVDEVNLCFLAILVGNVNDTLDRAEI